jgi:hypothetical protein
MTTPTSLDVAAAALASATHQEAEARAALDAARHTARRPLPMLDRLYIASPCAVPWESMTGDDRSRFCGECNKSVYNLSAMSRTEAEGFLQAAESPCVRFFQRTDGTILTSDCPVGVQRKVRRRWVAAMLTTAATVAASVGLFFGRRPGNLISSVLRSSEASRMETYPTARPVAGGPMYREPEVPKPPAPKATVRPSTVHRP